jgi:hypothetical protein
MGTISFDELQPPRPQVVALRLAVAAAVVASGAAFSVGLALAERDAPTGPTVIERPATPAEIQLERVR